MSIIRDQIENNRGTITEPVAVPSSIVTTATGTILTFSAATPPTGFLECDGAAISRTTYADLFAVIADSYGVGDGSTTFNIPDLRGEFIRGADNGRGVDTGRNLGTGQDQGTAQNGLGGSTNSTGAHTHSTPLNDGGFFAYSGGGGISGTNRPLGSNGTTSSAGDHSHTVTLSSTDDETRPRNIAMMFCIKT